MEAEAAMDPCGLAALLVALAGYSLLQADPPSRHPGECRPAPMGYDQGGRGPPRAVGDIPHRPADIVSVDTSLISRRSFDFEAPKKCLGRRFRLG